MEENIVSIFHKVIRDHDFHYLHLEYDGENHERMHIHDYYEMFLVQRGHIDYFVEGNRYVLGPGDLVITNPREMHVPVYKDRSYEICFISFRRMFLPDNPMDGFDPYEPFDHRKLGQGNYIASHLVKEYGIDRLYQEIEEKLRVEAPENVFFARAKLMELMLAVRKAVESNSNTYASNEMVTRVIHYINHHMEDDLSSEALGSRFFVDSKYLRQLFKQHTGYSIGDYVKNKRIIKAQELIFRGMSTHEAAAAVGYEEYTTFYRAFRKITGTAPSSTRE